MIATLGSTWSATRNGVRARSRSGNSPSSAPMTTPTTVGEGEAEQDLAERDPQVVPGVGVAQHLDVAAADVLGRRQHEAGHVVAHDVGLPRHRAGRRAAARTGPGTTRRAAHVRPPPPSRARTVAHHVLELGRVLELERAAAARTAPP